MYIRSVFAFQLAATVGYKLNIVSRCGKVARGIVRGVLTLFLLAHYDEGSSVSIFGGSGYGYGEWLCGFSGEYTKCGGR